MVFVFFFGEVAGDDAALSVYEDEVVASAEGEFGHPDGEEGQLEGLDHDASGGGAQDVDAIEEMGHAAFDVFEGTAAGVEGGVGHGDVVDLGKPTGQEARVVGFEAGQVEGGDQLHKYS